MTEAIDAIQRCMVINNIFRADGGSLGTARQRLVEAATTERFLMLDSDIVLESGPWFADALNSKECIVFQMPLAVPSLQRFVGFWSKLSPVPGLFFGTMATFFSKPMLEGIQIPDISGAEDVFILLFLQAKRIPVRVVWVPGMHHHSPSSKKGCWVGSALKLLQKKVGFRKVLPFVVRNVILYPFAVALASMASRSTESMRYGLALWREYLKGYLTS